MDHKHSCVTCRLSSLTTYHGFLRSLYCCKDKKTTYSKSKMLDGCKLWSPNYNRRLRNILERIAKRLTEGLYVTRPNPRTATNRHYRGTRHGIRKGGTYSHPQNPAGPKVGRRPGPNGYEDTVMPRGPERPT